MNKYTTIQGDTWDIISEKVYGTPYKIQTLIQANSEYRNVFMFDSNITLNVPDISEEIQDNKIPWRS